MKTIMEKYTNKKSQT